MSSYSDIVKLSLLKPEPVIPKLPKNIECTECDTIIKVNNKLMGCPECLSEYEWNRKTGKFTLILIRTYCTGPGGC